MNILLDTHVLIWVLEDTPLLSARAREAIIDGKNMVFVSSASVWEMSIKKAIGKYMDNYNQKRLHSAIDYQTPNEVYLQAINNSSSKGDKKLPKVS